MHGGGAKCTCFGELEMAVMDVMLAAKAWAWCVRFVGGLQHGRLVADTTVTTVMDILYRDDTQDTASCTVGP
jgi:hypothetical protein